MIPFRETQNYVMRVTESLPIYRARLGLDPLPVRFCCSCSRERTLNALSALPRTEVEELLAELGSITMDCEFCNQQYCFQREDLDAILQADDSHTLH